RVRLQLKDRTVENLWPIRIFPPDPAVPEGLAVRLVGGGLDSVKAIFPGAQAGKKCEGPVCVSSGMPPGGIEYVSSGGRLLCFALSRPFPLGDGSLLPGPGNPARVGAAISPHPIFNDFPHDGYCDRGFADVPVRFKLDLSALSPKIEPIIRALPERKGFLFELSVGKGRLLLCTMGPPERQRPPPSRVWRYLCAEMVKYLARPDLPEAQEVEPGALRKMLAPATVKD
ncbi:unnamed protein product, partial [marine sediment metagenome]